MILERIENGPFAVNTYLVGCPETRRGILIDPGHDAARIRRAIRSSGLEIEAIVNTHGHLDHLASARDLQTEMKIPFRIHRGDEFLLDTLPQSCAAFGLPPIPRPDVAEWLEAGSTMPIGGLSCRFRPAPGHSPGSLILDLGPEMIVGDVIFQGSIGRTDLPGGSLETLLASIQREVLCRDDAVVLHPGHGPATTVGAERRSNPFLAPGAEWT